MDGDKTPTQPSKVDELELKQTQNGCNPRWRGRIQRWAKKMIDPTFKQ